MCVAASARAQDPPAAAPAQPAPGPAAAAGPAAPAPPPAAGDEIIDPAADLAVEAVLDSKPDEPLELIRAASILASLDRVQLAKNMLALLAKAKLDPQAMADIVERAGSPVLVKLASDARLQPEAAVITAMLVRASQQARDPQRLAQFAAQLGSQSADERQAAALALLRAREAAIGPLMAVIADPRRQAVHLAARRLLIQIGADAEGPLLAMLTSGDERLKAAAVELLGEVGDADVAVYLLGPAFNPASDPATAAAARKSIHKLLGSLPTTDAAADLIERDALEHVRRATALSPDIPQTTVVWEWDSAGRRATARSYSAEQAHWIVAAQLARDLWQLRPNRLEARRLYLETLLTTAKLRHGWGKELPRGRGTAHAEAASLGAIALEDVLVSATRSGHVLAATAAVEILQDVGTSDLLTRGGSTPSPLAEAMRHPNKRLRFAALRAVMKLAPKRSFAGASYAVAALEFFAAAAGSPRAVVGHPNENEGQKIAGLLTELGYDVRRATNGRDAFFLATESPDCELIVLHIAIERPSLDELGMQLRKDRRTARTPILMVRTFAERDHAARLATAAARAIAAAPPLTIESLAAQIALLHAHSDLRPPTPAERLDWARAAIAWIEELTRSAQQAFDLRPLDTTLIASLRTPRLSPRSALALANLPSPEGQKELVDLASNSNQPPGAREAAVIAFRRSVSRYGILLTTDEMLAQYDRYNASATADRDTQRLLGSILDTLENKD